MGTEKTQWEVELDEDVSPAARKAESALARLQRQLQRLSAAGMSRAMRGLDAVRDRALSIRQRADRMALGVVSNGAAAQRDRAGKLRDASGRYVSESALGNMWKRISNSKALDMVPGLAAARGRKMGPFRQGSLDERAAGIGNRMAAGFDAARRSVNRVGGALSRLAKNETAGKVVEKLKEGVAGVALAAAAAVAGVMVSTTKTVDMAQKSRAAFTMMLGTAEQGQAAWTRSRQLAVELGMQIDTVADSYQRFISMGFQQLEAEELVRMGADMSALGATTEKVSSVLDAMGKIKATGTLQGDELMMLAEAGINIGAIYDKLGEKFGKTRGQIVKMKEAGKISAEDAIDAIKATVLATTKQTKFGEARKVVIGSTLGGGWDQLKAQIRDKMLDVAESAEGPLTRLMDNVRKRIGGALSGEDDARSTAAMGGAVSSIVDIIDGALPSIETFLRSISEGFSEAWGPIREMGTAFAEYLGPDKGGMVRDLGKSIGQLAAVFIAAAGAITVVFGGALLWIGKLIQWIVKAVDWANQKVGGFIFSFLDGAANQDAIRRSGAGGKPPEDLGGSLNGLRDMSQSVATMKPGATNTTVSQQATIQVTAQAPHGGTRAEGQAWGEGAAKGMERSMMSFFTDLNATQGT